MKRALLISALLLAATASWAADYEVQALKEPPPSEGLSPEIVAQLAPEGAKVMKGGTRTVASVWLCKSWPVKADFKPSSTVLYPFEVGQLMGVIHFRNKGADFRDQEIASGTYILRYAKQPEDGNHVGTSVTRDFLVMLPPKQDTSAGAIAEKELFKASAAAAGTSHPAMLSLVTAEKAKQSPALRHLEEPDWWILQLAGTATTAGKSAPLPLEVVIVGKAAE